MRSFRDVLRQLYVRTPVPLAACSSPNLIEPTCRCALRQEKNVQTQEKTQPQCVALQYMMPRKVGAPGRGGQSGAVTDAKHSSIGPIGTTCNKARTWCEGYPIHGLLLALTTSCLRPVWNSMTGVFPLDLPNHLTAHDQSMYMVYYAQNLLLSSFPKVSIPSTSSVPQVTSLQVSEDLYPYHDVPSSRVDGATQIPERREREPRHWERSRRGA